MSHERTHGPESCVGMPCCRGFETYCEDDPYECSSERCGCCCDVCVHTARSACAPAGGCCRCIPYAIALKFTPNSGLDCIARSHLMYGVEDESNSITTYSGFVPGVGSAEITIGTTGSEYYGNQRCVWTLKIDNLYILEELEIDHLTVNCGNIPSAFPVIENVQIGDCGCVGTISFERYDLYKVPFHSIDAFATEEQLYTACGSCLTVPGIICVTRREPGSTAVNVDYRHLFVWNGVDGWTGGFKLPPYSDECGSEFIRLVEIYGQCYLKFEDWNESQGGVFQDDLIPIGDYYDDCPVFDVEATDEDDYWVKIKSGQCDCWQYVCNECRCQCPSLCMIGFENGQFIGPLTLNWDEYNDAGWEGGGESVSIQAPKLDDCQTTKCQLVVQGFEDDPQDFTCGENVSFALSKQDEYGNYIVRIGWCSQGGGCDDANCLQNCDDVPAVLHADVTAVPWSGALGCDAIHGTPDCVDPFTVEMHVYKTLLPDAAAEVQWIGWKAFECRGCDGTSTPYTGAAVMIIELGCDGRLRVSVFDELGNISTHEDFINPPCVSCDGYPFEGTTVMPGAGTNFFCCENGGGWVVTVTE